MTIMSYEYKKTIAELCDALSLSLDDLRIFPLRITSRTKTQCIDGFIPNPDFTTLDRGTDKPYCVLYHSEIEIEAFTVNGSEVRGGYCPILNALIVDEKWLNARAKEIADGD